MHLHIKQQNLQLLLLVFKDAFERANSFDQNKVRDALAATNMQTFYGNIKFADLVVRMLSKPMVLFQVHV